MTYLEALVSGHFKATDRACFLGRGKWVSVVEWKNDLLPLLGTKPN